MTDYDTGKIRESVIAALAQRRPGLGRTALMKLIYFLQTLRGVPLGYSFRIYTYGPYDGQVLDDLQAVESVGAVRSQFYEYEYGTGYRIMAEDKAAELAQAANEQYGKELDEIVAEFGDWGAVDLEMASTIVYVDRRNAEDGTLQSTGDIAHAVRAMKPHLAEDRIESKVGNLRDKGLLRAVA